jgi:hypothetical protein
MRDHRAHPTPPTALSFINRTHQANDSNAMMTGHDDGSGASNHHRHFNGTPNASS